MGNLLPSFIFPFCGGKKNVDVLMVGFLNSGKKTILHQMKETKEVGTHLRDMKMTTIHHNDVSFNIWNVKWIPQENSDIQPSFLVPTTIKGIIVVIDSSDRESMIDVKLEFSKIMEQEQIRTVPILIFANKQDLPGAMQATELIDKLDLDYSRGRKWTIQTSCAMTAVGLVDGLQWLSNQFN